MSEIKDIKYHNTIILFILFLISLSSCVPCLYIVLEVDFNYYPILIVMSILTFFTLIIVINSYFSTKKRLSSENEVV